MERLHTAATAAAAAPPPAPATSHITPTAAVAAAAAQPIPVICPQHDPPQEHENEAPPPQYAHSSPHSPNSLPNAVTDTQLLQLSLKNAVAAAAAGKATIAANNYALVVKIFFRKCFLLEELVLLALAMGSETRKSDEEAAAEKGKAAHGGPIPQDEHLHPAAATVTGNTSNARADTDAATVATAAAGRTQEQLVDPLANVGMLLPPGLDEDDYDEERTYYALKRERDAAKAHAAAVQPSPAPSAAPGSGRGGSANTRESSKAGEDDTPGYDAATARWLACLLAKVHPDALPIATLEKLCRVPIPSRPTASDNNSNVAGGSGASSAGSPFSLGGPGSRNLYGSPVSSHAAPSPANNNTDSTLAFPAAVADTGGNGGNGSGNKGVFSPTSACAIARLIPHLKTSSSSSLAVGVGSPTVSTAGTAIPTSTTNAHELASVFGSSSSTSLSLLFATLLWDVACALWNEGFVEETHHWLSVLDVRRLWKLYYNSCAGSAAVLAAAAAAPKNTNACNDSNSTGFAGSPIRNLGRNTGESSNTVVSPESGGMSRELSGVPFLYASAEPPEESVACEERACALSWFAVLAECRAVDEPPPTPAAPLPNTGSPANLASIHISTTMSTAAAAIDEAVASAVPAFPSTSGSTIDQGEAWHPSRSDHPLEEEEEEESASADTVDRTTATRANDSCADDSPSASAAASAASLGCGADGGAVNAAAIQAIPTFVRRLARRTTALRDLCGLVIACETAEDVFYVMYAFHCALETQQRKTEQLQQQQQQQQQSGGGASAKAASHPTAAAAVATGIVASGGLAEVLIVANMLVEFFLSKRAQRILIDEGVLAPVAQGLSGTTNSHTEAHAGIGRSAASPLQPQAHHLRRSEMARRMDRAVRHACDEIVCAFTNGQCLTLYGLESYGIPTARDVSSGRGSGFHLLATELPYVLVSNVLSSTLNFVTLYRLSKVYRGVIDTAGGCASSSTTNSNNSSHANEARAADPNFPAKERPRSTTNLLAHPNRTRKATDEEKLRRRRWTRPANDESAPLLLSSGRSAAAGRRLSSRQGSPSLSQPASATHSVVGEIFDFMKGAAVSWRNIGNFVSSATADSEAPQQQPASAHPTDATHHHDASSTSSVVPSAYRGDGRPPMRSADTEGLHDPVGDGYAERLAAARRDRQGVGAGLSGHRTGETCRDPTPWSATSPTAITSNNSSLADASAPSSCEDIYGAAAATATSRRNRGAPEMKTRGPGACELLLPSHPALASGAAGSNNAAMNVPNVPNLAGSRLHGVGDTDDAAAAAVTTAPSSVPLTLLAEEKELSTYSPGTSPSGLQRGMPRAAAATGPAGDGNTTVLHTPTVQLQSRSPNEACSLRLLTMLYRYPQLHTLESVTASRVDLVARELNKALHILQVAMRTRFGDRWWLQWRARRETETQRYYARALADAQRGVFDSTEGNGWNRGNNNAGGATGANSSTSVGATTAITPGQPVPASTAATSSGDRVLPPTMMGATAVQSDPSLLLLPSDNQPMQSSLAYQAQRREQERHEQQEQLRDDGFPVSDDAAVPPPCAPPVTQPPVHAELSKFWSTRTLSIPSDEALRERRQNLRSRSGDDNTNTNTPLGGMATDANAETPASEHVTVHTAHRSSSFKSVSSTVSLRSANERGTAGGAERAVMDVNWDVPPSYTPEVSLDFSAFTTSSVETQEATRQLVETLQRQQRDADDENATVAGVSLLSPACRRQLHDALPLLQQYSPWRVVYSTRMHGVSLSTLFANCQRESDRCANQAFSGLLAAAHAAASTSSSANSVDGGGTASRPMLLVLELPPSTSFRFAEDDAGVRTASAPSRASGGSSHGSSHSDANRLYIGAYLSDLLKLETRRYYGTQDCFVFQLLVPGAATVAAVDGSTATVAPSSPQLHVFRATRQNTQYINCRPTSIVIGGGGGGSSLYLDDSLAHGATSACATFNSPPLSVWKSAVSTLCRAAGAANATVASPTATGAPGDTPGQQSLRVLNVEAIVIDV